MIDSPSPIPPREGSAGPFPLPQGRERTSRISRLLNPRSIAFIGGAECGVAISRTRELRFTGEIFAVHPTRAELGGIAAVKSLADIPSPIDAAFIAVKREPTIEIVRTLRKMGCGGAVIYASGFAETGNADLQHELLKAADGMPLMGPNCYGFVNGLSRAALWPDEHGIEPCDTGVAIITQSGNIACNFTMTRRALPVAAVFAIGNQADIDMAQMLEALAQDERITAIGLHIEGLPDIPAFAAAAAACKKPIIALKTGRSEQGAKVAMSHTSSLAGADSLYDALFKRHGIARMKSITAFVETLKFLHHGGALPGNRIVSMSCSGGEAALAADMALEKDVTFPPFNADTRSKVAATLNEYVSIDNPLDYHTFIWNQPEKLSATFTAVLRGGYDVAMLILDIPANPKMNPASWLVTARALAAAAKATKARAAIVATISECMPLALAEELSAQGIAPMMGLDDALTAIEAASLIGAPRETPPPILAVSEVGSGEHILNEFEAKQLLKSYGLAVPEGLVCKSDQAIAAATKLGFPVTLKISSTAIIHKSDAGGVALNLKTADEVAAASGMGSELLVEKMITGTVAELIIGLTSDPQFGLALVIGAGGTLTELLQDSVSLILPTTRQEIETALKSLKVWKLIAGFRGKSGDAEAAIAAIQSVAAFAAAHRGRIIELDVNPLLILPKGAVAVDAYIKMRTP